MEIECTVHNLFKFDQNYGDKCYCFAHTLKPPGSIYLKLGQDSGRAKITLLKDPNRKYVRCCGEKLQVFIKIIVILFTLCHHISSRASGVLHQQKLLKKTIVHVILLAATAQ